MIAELPPRKGIHLSTFDLILRVVDFRRASARSNKAAFETIEQHA